MSLYPSVFFVKNRATVKLPDKFSAFLFFKHAAEAFADIFDGIADVFDGIFDAVTDFRSAVFDVVQLLI